MEIEQKKEWLRLLYNDYRTALLNKKYYGYRLAWKKKLNVGINIFAALFSTGGTFSLVLGWSFVDEETKKNLTICAAVLSTIVTASLVFQKYLNLENDIERYSKLCVEHSKIAANLRAIVDDLKYLQDVTNADITKRAEIIALFNDLESADEEDPSARLMSRAQKEVNAEVPPTSFWMP